LAGRQGAPMAFDDEPAPKLAASCAPDIAFLGIGLSA
jgi:hypothetical protein